MSDLTDYETRVTGVMGRLKAELNCIHDFVPIGAPIVYIDPPIHLNVGDLLINLGTERFLRDSGYNVEHRLSLLDYKRFSNLIRKDHVLLFHGGGNLGDIWPNHEILRQNLLRAFPENKAVVLPQTVHVKDRGRVEEFSKAYREHSDCMILTRDQRSYDLVANGFGVRSHLVPDLAHYLFGSEDFQAFKPATGELLLLRTDLEAGPRGAHLAHCDWSDLVTKAQYLKHKALSGLMASNPLEGAQPSLLGSWYKERDAIIAHCVSKFQSYASISTDRLHGTILGLLLGKVVVMRDNNYGKLSVYANAWLEGLPTVAEASVA